MSEHLAGGGAASGGAESAGAAGGSAASGGAESAVAADGSAASGGVESAGAANIGAASGGVESAGEEEDGADDASDSETQFDYYGDEHLVTFGYGDPVERAAEVTRNRQFWGDLYSGYTFMGGKGGN